jgi:diguanylate cyclase (GGDEF)-like protein
MGDGTELLRHGFGRESALRRDRVTVAAIAWALLAMLMFVLLSGHRTGSLRIFWSFQPPLDLLFAYSSWRVSRLATGVNRRFWRIMVVAASMFVFGDSVQSALTFSGGTSRSVGGSVQSACLAGGLVVIVVAMLCHPHPGRGDRERRAFWLDSAAVLVGGTVLAWSFAFHPGADGTAGATGTLVAAAGALTAAFAAVKMVLGGNAPMRKAAALTMIASAAVNSVAFFLHAAPGSPWWPLVLTVKFVPSLLIALGPRVQESIARGDVTAFTERRRKPYSLLPYGSIVLVLATLVAVLPHDLGLRVWGVVAGLGLICVLVGGRQLASFHDNAHLIANLDSALGELRVHEARLRHQALFDGLTGLANRTHFHDEVEAALVSPARVSVLLIDLDGFKSVNDTLGHAAGDTLLVGVAAKLRESIRTDDLAARLGGDEFAVLLRNCEPGEAERTAQRVLAALTIPIAVNDTAVCAGASIGVAGATPGDGVGSLIRAADMAMYAAKHDGKGTWMRYDASMEPAAR